MGLTLRLGSRWFITAVTPLLPIFKSCNPSHPFPTAILFCYRVSNVTCSLHVIFKCNFLSVSAIAPCIMRSPKFRFFLKFNYLVLCYNKPSPINISDFILSTHPLCVCVSLILITVAGVSAYLPVVLKIQSRSKMQSNSHSYQLSKHRSTFFFIKLILGGGTG